MTKKATVGVATGTVVTAAIVTSMLLAPSEKQRMIYVGPEMLFNDRFNQLSVAWDTKLQKMQTQYVQIESCKELGDKWEVVLVTNRAPVGFVLQQTNSCFYRFGVYYK